MIADRISATSAGSVSPPWRYRPGRRGGDPIGDHEQGAGLDRDIELRRGWKLVLEPGRDLADLRLRGPSRVLRRISARCRPSDDVQTQTRVARKLRKGPFARPGDRLSIVLGNIEFGQETGDGDRLDAALATTKRLETLIDDLADVMKERELVDEKEVVDLETGFVLGTSLRPRLDHSLLRARNRS